jgi:hypothetical protein
VHDPTPSAPPPPPVTSALRGAPRELLYALLEVCAAATDEETRSLPTVDLALAACMGELRKLGVHRAAPPNEAAVRLHEREAELSARVAELESVVRQWDKAAESGAAGSPASSAFPSLPSTVTAAADSRVIDSLTPMPSIDAALAELGALAALCSEQVDAVSRQIVECAGAAEGERQLLAKSAHQANFRGYLDVEDPKVLVRSLLAI